MMHRLTSTGYVCVENPKENIPIYLIQSHRMHGSLERTFICFFPPLSGNFETELINGQSPLGTIYNSFGFLVP